MIDMGLYRHFYRQKRTYFAGARDGTIHERATFSTPSSIKHNDTEDMAWRQLRPLSTAPDKVSSSGGDPGYAKIM